MTDRGLPIVDGAPACPFVAFEDDRDERATSPDHRHRCYAEVRPAPRALAHQEAYCLSSAFPVCPTFQDWARREAARARESRAGTAAPSEEIPQRNPPRDWSAPPPWSSEPGTPRPSAPPAGDEEPEPPDFLSARSREGQGLAGSPADRLAGERFEPPGAEPVDRAPAERAPARDLRHEADEDLDEGDEGDREWDDAEEEAAAVRGRRGGGIGLPIGDRRPRVGQTRPRRTNSELNGPTWERPRRYEAYPTLRTRIGLPSIPPVGMMVAAIVIAALALFFLPTLLGFGGPDGGTGTATPSPSTGGSAGPSGSVEPTAAPAPTPQTYVVQSGDTMSRIASQFGVSLDALIAANRETVPDPDKLDVGDILIIPGPSSEPVVPSASASGEASPAP
jgi:nucleoid-associated protein YgaU